MDGGGSHPPLVGKKRLARLLGVAKDTLTAWIDRWPDFPVVSRGDAMRAWQFDAQEVRTFLDVRRAEDREARAAKRAELRSVPDNDKAVANAARDFPIDHRYSLSRARLVERRIAIQEGQLASTSEVRQTLQPAIARLGRHIDSVLLQLARKHQWPAAVLRDVLASYRDVREAFIHELGATSSVAASHQCERLAQNGWRKGQ